jgi:hypothetical protein
MGAGFCCGNGAGAMAIADGKPFEGACATCCPGRVIGEVGGLVGVDRILVAGVNGTTVG